MDLLKDARVVEKLRVVLAILAGDKSISEASRDTGRGRGAIRGWVGRYQAQGLEGLRNKPRGRSQSLSKELEQDILRLKRERRSRSARKLRDLLPGEEKPHRQTVWRVLVKHGEHRREFPQLKPDKDFEYPEPNDCWQVDLMDGIIVKGVGLVYLHSFLDDHSRDIMGGEWFKSRSADHVLKVMKEAFEKNGLPKRILADQGTQFKRNLGPGLTRYERVLHALGVQAIFASKGRPKAKGKKERWYRFVQEDFLPEHTFRSLDDLNAKWQEWVQWYRHQHEHSSLGGYAPATRYARVKKRKPPLPLEDVFAEVATRLVRKNASISYKGRVYPLEPALMGRRVEVRSFNGRVRVFHGRTLVGTFNSAIDYRQRMLRRLQVRVVKRDGAVKFQGKRYRVGRRRAGTRVEVLKSRGKVHVYLPRDKEKVFEVRRRYCRRS